MLNQGQFDSETWFPALTKAMLQATHWIHVLGLAHCDIHAGNVFLKFIPDALAPDDVAISAAAFKLGDFGLCRAVENMDPRGTFLNRICPPEAIDPGEFGLLDHRSDVYQTGLLLLNALVGEELAFNENEILKGKPREYAENLSSPWGDFVSLLLRRHSEFRPETSLQAWRLYRKVPRNN